MKNFDDLVRKAKNTVELKTITYIAEEEYSTENWPMKFLFPPRKGDLVRSKNGATLEIKGIIHIDGGRIILLLGRDGGGSTAIEGSGSNF